MGKFSYQTLIARFHVICIFGNYWMTLSRIWRSLQIKEGVIHRSRRSRWRTPSEICRILYILRKPNSIIALLFIQNISPSFTILLFVFPLTKQKTTSSLDFLGQRFNNLQRATFLTSFWRQRFNNLQRVTLLTSDWIFGQQQLVMVNYGCGFNQSETGKFFDWIIILFTSRVPYLKKFPRGTSLC